MVIGCGYFISRNYGCGAVYPEAVEGCKVLDLGSGAGLDCFVLSKLVGPQGHVTGIDMTKEQVIYKRRGNGLFYPLLTLKTAGFQAYSNYLV